jgi:hypothetical protein
MKTTRDWKLMEDPANVENLNAGNGGDLVKHTVYLALLRHLLAREPWREELLLRECHAGRGVYHIVAGERRSRLLSCLCSDPTGDSPVLLQNAQRRALGALACWPSGAEAVHWYAGSALLNTIALADTRDNRHKLELYEWLPETRKILRLVLAAAHPEGHQAWSVLPEEEQSHEFDGEDYIERNISHWGKQNVVLLDPFAMWRQPTDQHKRDRFGAIIDGLPHHGSDAPSLVLFWTWGRAFPAADGDLDGTARHVRNGYADLRAKLHNAGLHFVLVKWRWGLQFAMWVVVPAGQLTSLRGSIDFHCRLLSDHLIRQGCSKSLSHPQVEVVVD